MNKSRGFTLIELLVTISIIALLSSIVLAAVIGARDKARIGADEEFDANVYHGLGDKIVGWWNFADCATAADFSGNGNTGSLVGAPTFSSSDTPTNTGCSIVLDGSSQYVSIPSSPALTLTGPFTISAWIKPSSGPAGYDVIVGEEDGSNGYYLSWHNSAILLGANRGNPEFSSSPITDFTKWHFVVGTFDGSTYKIYIDGKLNTSLSSAVAPRSSSDTIVGIGHDSVADYFPGKLDDVRIYASAITAYDTESMYALGAPAHGIAVR
jgi:prepilin-type N-terminal cleavage/methylation domain-containing protein